MPCLEPVRMMEVGDEAVEWVVARGRRVLRPLVMPKRFTGNEGLVEGGGGAMEGKGRKKVFLPERMWLK
jgi:hypothetical protein